MVPRSGFVAGGAAGLSGRGRGPVRPYSRPVADFPFAIPDSLRDEVGTYADVEGKIPRALDRLGDLAGRDVVLFDADDGLRARQLSELGATVTPLAHGLPSASADAVVSFWSAFRPSSPDGRGSRSSESDPSGESDRAGDPDRAAEADLAEADRVLRPGGRLLVVQDYGRDDLSRLLPAERSAAAVTWSRRDGWFPAHGFRLHVIHAFWTFPDLERLTSTVEALFGPDARGLLGDLRRPRLSWKVVVYDRVRGGAASA